MRVDLQELWTSVDWHAEVAGWISGVLAEHGIEQTGPIEQPRVRPWSTQLTVPTDHGVLWFKENNPGQRFEAAVVEVLGRLAPDHVVQPLAIEAERGWMLAADQGQTLAALGLTDEHLWVQVVSDFADLQRRVARHRDELTSAGLDELPPWLVPEYLRDQVEFLVGLPAHDTRRIDRALADRVVATLPQLEESADLLRNGPVPLSLEHNDLHHNNAFVPEHGARPLRFFDFGDALWAHPFTSLLITTRVLAVEWNTEPTDPRIGRITDAYLEVWTDLASQGELRSLLTAALRFGNVNRFESWRRVLEYADDDARREWGDSLGDWLGNLLDHQIH